MSILQEMRDRVTKRTQWTKYKIATPKQNRFCMVGWVGRIQQEQHVHHADAFQAKDLLMEVIREQFPERLKRFSENIPTFNDHPDTTFEDVRLVIEKAAIKEQEQI